MSRIQNVLEALADATEHNFITGDMLMGLHDALNRVPKEYHLDAVEGILGLKKEGNCDPKT